MPWQQQRHQHHAEAVGVGQRDRAAICVSSGPMRIASMMCSAVGDELRTPSCERALGTPVDTGGQLQHRGDAGVVSRCATGSRSGEHHELESGARQLPTRRRTVPGSTGGDQRPRQTNRVRSRALPGAVVLESTASSAAPSLRAASSSDTHCGRLPTARQQAARSEAAGPRARSTERDARPRDPAR